MNTILVLGLIYLLMAGQYAELTGKTVAELPSCTYRDCNVKWDYRSDSGFYYDTGVASVYYRFPEKRDSVCGRVKT